MSRITRILATSAALMTLSACGSSSGGALEAQLQGVWSACAGAGGASEKVTVTFSGLNFTSRFDSYSANETCSGTPTLTDSDTGSYVVGATVTAPLGSAAGAPTVTAYQVNGTNASTGSQVYYDLAYVDTTVTPNRFYTGDTSGANDGSTAATRPTTLDTHYLSKQ
jgi:hypothetical protein